MNVTWVLIWNYSRELQSLHTCDASVTDPGVYQMRRTYTYTTCKIMKSLLAPSGAYYNLDTDGSVTTFISKLNSDLTLDWAINFDAPSGPSTSSLGLSADETTITITISQADVAPFYLYIIDASDGSIIKRITW